VLFWHNVNLHRQLFNHTSQLSRTNKTTPWSHERNQTICFVFLWNYNVVLILPPKFSANLLCVKRLLFRSEYKIWVYRRRCRCLSCLCRQVKISLTGDCRMRCFGDEVQVTSPRYAWLSKHFAWWKHLAYFEYQLAHINSMQYGRHFTMPLPDSQYKTMTESLVNNLMSRGSAHFI